jgi:nucleoside-diphosphate-sugar epimerase
MPPVLPPARILVTGVNGFIGSHVARTLLCRGYRVRGTVRVLCKGDFLANHFIAEFGAGKFEVAVVPDLLAEDAFDEALKDITGIVHLASAVTLEATDPDLQIRTAELGTLGLLKAAAKMKQVGSVVVTGSFAAVMFSEKGQGEDVDETDWNVVSEWVHTHGGAPDELKGLHSYLASKTAAEKAAWKYVEKQEVNGTLVYVPPQDLFCAVSRC